MLRLVWVIGRALLSLWPRLRRLPGQAAVALGAPGLGEPARPRRLWQTLALAAPVALLAATLLPRVSLVMSPSIEAWAVTRAPGPYCQGRLRDVSAEPPDRRSQARERGPSMPCACQAIA